MTDSEKSKMDEHLNKALNILTDLGYNVLYVAYYGAHNYNLADEKSDYDFKAIVIPTLAEMIKRSVISKTVECDFGNIDVKDFLTFTTNMNKGNFSYIEAIRTPYNIDKGKEYLGVSVVELFSGVRVNYMSMVGAIYEKRKALTHEYPSKAKEFEEFGCDPKQFMQAIRLYDLLRKRSVEPEIFDLSYYTYGDEGIQFELIEFESEASSRKYEFTRDDLIAMKRGLLMPLDETIRMFDYIQVKARELLPKDYKYSAEDYTDIAIDLLVKYYTGELA